MEKYIDGLVDSGVSVEQVNHSYFSDFLDNKSYGNIDNFSAYYEYMSEVRAYNLVWIDVESHDEGGWIHLNSENLSKELKESYIGRVNEALHGAYVDQVKTYVYKDKKNKRVIFYTEIYYENYTEFIEDILVINDVKGV